MKWDKCYTGVNNKFIDTPPLMSDGRLYTSFKPKKEENDNFLKKMNFKDNNEYREYLVKNADSIIEYNQLIDCRQSNNCKSYEGTELVKNPNNFKYCYLNNETPFVFSDLKKNYLEKEKKQMKKTKVYSKEEVENIKYK